MMKFSPASPQPVRAGPALQPAHAFRLDAAGRFLQCQSPFLLPHDRSGRQNCGTEREALCSSWGKCWNWENWPCPPTKSWGAAWPGAGADAVFWLGGHGDAVYRGLMEAGFTGRFTELAAHDIFLPEFSALGKRTPGRRQAWDCPVQGVARQPSGKTGQGL